MQFAFNAISKEDLEIDEYNMHILDAQVEQQKALVELKTIRAAFDGHRSRQIKPRTTDSRRHADV